MVQMWKCLPILLWGTVQPFLLQRNYSCNDGSTCIPLSECPQVREMLRFDDLVDDARKLFCGYFHEPYVCCDKNCYTPNGNYGKSVLLDACPHLKANEHSDDQRRQKFFLESHLNTTHVCCNIDEDMYTLVPPAPIGVITPVPVSTNCITPNGEKAKCVHVSDCGAYKEVAEDTDVNFRFMNDSFCGLWNEPMVCCGETSQYKESYVENLPANADCGIWNEKVYSNIPPWLVLIQSLVTTCVGVVINQKYVISTIQCVGDDFKYLDVRLGECIDGDNRADCKLEVAEMKIFPLHTYLHTEDIGVVLLKLRHNIRLEDLMPVCLPFSELAIGQDIHIVGLEKSMSIWNGTNVSTITEENDSCYTAMKIDFQRIVCIKKRFCDTKRRLLQNVVLFNDYDKWYLGGLFNKDTCYGPNKTLLNAVYVYTFLPWIRSNIN